MLRLLILKIILRKTKKRNNNNNNSKPHQKSNHRLQQVVRLFVGPAKGVKNSEAPHINKDSLSPSMLMLFFTEVFHLLLG
jgi:hypothetical protein